MRVQLKRTAVFQKTNDCQRGKPISEHFERMESEISAFVSE
jgi:hypothetical protein